MLIRARRHVSFLFGIAIATFCIVVEKSYGADHEGVKSPLTSEVGILSRDPLRIKSLFGTPESGDLSLRCFKDSGDEWYIVVSQSQVIDAPIVRVQDILRNFADYKNWNEDMITSSEEVVGKNRKILTTETSVPIPFVSNTKVALIYDITASESQVFFHYQLHKSNVLTMYDGFIFLESVDSRRTRFIELDAFNADWGILKTGGVSGVWTQSLEQIFQSDLALKLLAEDSKLSPDDVKKKARDFAKRQSFGSCLKKGDSLEAIYRRPLSR